MTRSRRLAQRIGVEPSYLSKIARGLETLLSEETTRDIFPRHSPGQESLCLPAGTAAGLEFPVHPPHAPPAAGYKLRRWRIPLSC